ncbi:RNA polymerase sigma factor [Candidatus Peribacteria bacterium]|nr:RNA polymerase sigma factor [Candidatus Peribacteria bacterium]
MSNNTEPVSDVQLYRNAVSGDLDAEGELLSRIYNYSRGMCIKIIGHTEDGEDAVQEAMLRIHVGLNTFAGIGSSIEHTSAKFRTWAHRITRNASVDVLRKRKRNTITIFDDSTLTVLARNIKSTAPSAFEMMDRDELRRLVRSVVNRLPDHHREPVILKYQEDLNDEEIAEQLEIPVGTIKSRLNRACKIITTELTEVAFRYMSAEQRTARKSKFTSRLCRKCNTHSPSPQRTWRRFESLSDLLLTME